MGMFKNMLFDVAPGMCVCPGTMACKLLQGSESRVLEGEPSSNVRRLRVEEGEGLDLAPQVGEQGLRSCV